MVDVIKLLSTISNQLTVLTGLVAVSLLLIFIVAVLLLLIFIVLVNWPLR